MGAVKTVWSYGKDVGQMKNTPNGWFISYEDENPTPIDQRFFPGLLCNYDSAAEKMNAIMGIAGGLLQTLQESPLGKSSGSGGMESASGGEGSEGSSMHSHASASGASIVDCTLCLGSGRCKYCNGDGYNYTSGTAVQCNGCKGHIGKCKRCNGTGKISRSGKVKY